MPNNFTIKSQSSNEVTFSFEKRWLTILTKVLWYGLLSLIIFIIIFYFFDDEYVLALFVQAWISFIIVGAVFTLASFLLKKYLIKEIQVNRKQIHFKYYNEILNEKIQLPIEEVNLICTPSSDKIKVRCLDHKFNIPSNQFTLFLDQFAHVTNLKFEETLRLNDKQEVLKYKALKNLNTKN